MRTLLTIMVAVVSYSSLLYLFTYTYLIKPRRDVMKRNQCKEMRITSTGDLIQIERKEPVRS